MGKINGRIIWALLKRDLRMYFSNPSGYVFITLFIFLSAASAFWQDRFFLTNLANLDRLNEVFPYLLLFFVPALTMAVWSEERKSGTDELLLTLPATDLEIVLGKYLSVLGIYTASLVLSLSHVLVLIRLGSPDIGLMFANYVGYWLLGGTLIAAGMLASLLTRNATIAFILGSLLCAALVLLGTLVSIFSPALGQRLGAGGLVSYFFEFSRGVVSIPGVLYFLTILGFLLYLNVVIIGRRHWPPEADGYRMGSHHTVRAVALGVGLLSLNAMVGRSSLRLDATAENLHSLSAETEQLLGEIDPERPVLIHAFISPEVPEHMVQTRESLLSVLREVDAVGGARVELMIEDTEPFTEAARSAREKFGITARQVPNLSSARASLSEVFMGLAVTCGASEQVLPFLDRGLPVEYEIARSVRVVAKTERKKIGVVNSELRLFGGLEFETMQNSPPWSVVDELKKQYEVVQISADTPISNELDGLLVVLPSSLPQAELDNLADFIQKGTPALILDDPLPIVNLGLAPSERAGANRNPFMSQGQPPPKDKGDIEGWMARLGVTWNKGQIVWDTYNPHPDLAHLPPEVVFVGPGSGASAPFSKESRATSALQELVMLHPGSIEKRADSPFSFTPLLTTGRMSGQHEYATLVRSSFLGASLNPRPPHKRDDREKVIAAQVMSGPPAASKPADGEGGEAAASTPVATGGSTSVIVIADVDFISEQFFAIRRSAPANLNFDNVTFFLNAIDVLVGDESFIDLRNRRVAHRTLTEVEKETAQFIEKRASEETAAETEAERALADAQQRLTEKVQQVQQRSDLDVQTKQIMARNLEEVENRRFEVLKVNIEAKKEAEVQRSKETMEAQIRSIQSRIRTSAVLLPPIPALALGALIFFRRQKREREGAAAARRLRD